jgi:hypothetical protein
LKFDNLYRLKKISETPVEWIILKRKYHETNHFSPSSSKFFSNTLQKTKNNFSRFSQALQSIKLDKETLNKSISNSSNYFTISKLVKRPLIRESNLNTSSFSASNLTNIGEIDGSGEQSVRIRTKKVFSFSILYSF